MPNNGGQFWYGSTTNFPGFLYKKNSRVGTKKITQFAPGGNLTCNTSQDVFNKYQPGGSGIGSTNTAVRRAKNRNASQCNSGKFCASFYQHLGRYANYTNNPNGFFVPNPYASSVVRRFNPSATVSMFGVLPQQLS